MPDLDRFEYLEVSELMPLPRLLRRSVDDDRIRELALSIKEFGLINPITVRPHDGGFQIVAGFCRWMAHKWIGREKILCRIKDISDGDLDFVAGVENLQRQDLNPVEEALLLKKLTSENGLSVPDISRLLSKSESWVRGRLEVLLWPEVFIDALGNRRLSFSALSELVRVGDEQYRDHLLSLAIQNGATALVCQGWRLGWEQTQAIMPDETLSAFRPHVERAEVLVRLICWGCSVECLPVDLSYKPLCVDCIKRVE